MYRSISFSTICGLALICLSTTVPSAKADDAVPPVAVKETKFLLEDAKQLEKAKTELCVALLASIQQKGQSANDIRDAISILSKLRYEPSINFTVLQIEVRNIHLVHKQTRLSYIVINQDPFKATPFNFPAIQALIDHGPAAIPPLVKAYVAHKKELVEKPEVEPDIVLRNIEAILIYSEHPEYTLVYLNRTIKEARLKEVLGIEMEVMVELRTRINEEVKRRR